MAPRPQKSLPLLQVSQQSELEQMASAASSQGESSLDTLPSTLQEALLYGGGDMFNSLFRLCVRLRSDKGGCDTRWLPNARGARRTSKTLNWHQFNEHQLAAAQAELETPQHHFRASRLESWKQMSKQAREQLHLAPEGPERLRCLGLLVKPCPGG